MQLVYTLLAIAWNVIGTETTKKFILTYYIFPIVDIFQAKDI